MINGIACERLIKIGPVEVRRSIRLVLNPPLGRTQSSPACHVGLTVRVEPRPLEGIIPVDRQGVHSYRRGRGRVERGALPVAIGGEPRRYVGH